MHTHPARTAIRHPVNATDDIAEGLTHLPAVAEALVTNVREAVEHQPIEVGGVVALSRSMSDPGPDD